MTKRINYLFIIIPILLWGCDDFIAKNITEETPVIILPVQNDTISYNPIHFKWEEVEGATQYRVEIVSPNFSNIENFPIDSIVNSTQLFVGLDSNYYEVRITALNAGYTSQKSEPRAFFVGSSQGSSTTGVTLNAPLNNAYLNGSFQGNFSWYGLSDAVNYTFELHESNSFSGPLKHIQDQLVTNSITSNNGSDLNEGVYCWGVKAYRTGGVETNFTKRIFYIDKTNPGSASPLTPATGTTSNAGSITFTWNQSADIGTVQSPIISILEIATDMNFNNMLTPQTSSTNSKAVTLASGSYYWRVRLIDEAGNMGSVPAGSNILNVVP